ncbi:MAG: polysaccharide deacetylase family protein [Candidatus Rokubacteria bacterium]|nr:polysaccharide deacetylase family protein [Candidatus Rokubacteria bacterium]
MVANLLTFDIEGFIEASHDQMHVPAKYISEVGEAREIEVNTLKILELLEEFDQRATFFVLGRIGRDMPGLVRRIAAGGHEIACHSFDHRRLYGFPRPEVERFLVAAKRALEDASGRPVHGFRAPDFSIVEANAWVFDALREIGFVYDSSVYPIGFHDVYGIGGFPAVPFRMPNGLIEVPLSTVRLLNRNIPFGGGGYLRIYPFLLTKTLFAAANRRGVPGIVYLHPFEIGEIVPRIAEMTLARRLRTYTGVRSAREKLRALLSLFPFTRVVDYLEANTLPDLVAGKA